MSSKSPPPPSPVAAELSAPAAGVPGARPAGCLVRMIALVVDLMLVAVLLVIARLVLGQIFEIELSKTLLDPAGRVFDDLKRRYDIIWLGIALALPLAYAVITEMTGRAATLGKRLVGLAVVSASGGRAGPFRAVARNLAKMISAIPCMLGFAIAIFPGKRALHDLLTGSRVVHRERKSILSE